MCYFISNKHFFILNKDAFFLNTAERFQQWIIFLLETYFILKRFHKAALYKVILSYKKKHCSSGGSNNEQAEQ